MSAAATLTAQFLACLEDVKQANGYPLDFKSVHEAGDVKPDQAPLPVLLVSTTEDAAEDIRGPVVKRVAEFQVEGIFSRSASLGTMQDAYHACLIALGYGQHHKDRPLKQGDLVEESVEYDMAASGGPQRRFIASISVRYVEHY